MSDEEVYCSTWDLLAAIGKAKLRLAFRGNPVMLKIARKNRRPDMGGDRSGNNIHHYGEPAWPT
ncbi:MAG: hypothetical protein HDQ91_04555 [Desulfovibrio sp.]|nr:hypothetical protein [Desulfovibrio sp.]